MNNISHFMTMTNYRTSHINQSSTQINPDDLQNQFQIQSFKQKFIFQPFQYQDTLEQTLVHEIKSFNPKVVLTANIHQNKQDSNNFNNHKQSVCYDPNAKSYGNNNNNVQFIGHSNIESFNSTSKSIKTNKTIFCSPTDSPHTPKNNISYSSKAGLIHNLSQVNQLLSKQMLLKPPSLNKKQSSMTSNAKSQFFQTQINENDQFTKQNRTVVFNGRSMKKKTLFNKQKYLEQKKQKINKSSFKSTQQKQSKSLSTQSKNLGLATLQYGTSLCQSIALGSSLVQNFLKSTYDGGFFKGQMLTNTSQGTKNSSLLPQPLSFYSFCMLLFPQTSKSIPCSTFVIDTLFYTSSNDSKDIIYVFRDRRKNMLMKMKNKNRNAYELFLKRRQHYQVNKTKQDKLKKAGFIKQKQTWKNGNKQSHNGNKVNNYLYGANNKKTSNLDSQQQILQKQKQYCKNYDSLTPQRKFVYSVKCLQDQEQKRQFQQHKNKQQFSQNQILKKTYSNNIIDEEEEGQFSYHNEQSHNVQEIQQQNSNNDQCENDDNQQSSADIQINSIIQSSQGSLKDLKQRLTKLSFQTTHKNFFTSTYNNLNYNISPYPTTSATPSLQCSPIITPSNSIRQSYNIYQPNYMALLKYHSNHIIRLKTQQFKAIFNNPLYANQRFKHTNNTQYIQALPQQLQQNDIKLYSIHFHYEIFKDEELFKYVSGNLFKENQYMVAPSNFNANGFGSMNIGSKNKQQQSNNNNGFYMGYKYASNMNNANKAGFNSISEYRKNSTKLKNALKSISIQIYLYYQIFQMYTYISMHHNKQVLNGIFRFVQYENDYALFQTENLIVKQMHKQGEYIKAKIFKDQSIFTTQNNADALLKLNNIFNKQFPTFPNSQQTSPLNSNASTPSPTIKKINNQILKLSLINKQQPITQLQKQIKQFFSSQNKKIEQDMTNYFIDKIETIKNVKDQELSKNIFKIINNDVIQTKIVRIKAGDRVNNNQHHVTNLNGNTNKYMINKMNKNNEQKVNNDKTTQFDENDFHNILNDEKRLQKFLKKKQDNDEYSRKNISNFSVVRWKKQVEKVRQRNKQKQLLQNQKQNTNQFNEMSSTFRQQKFHQIQNHKSLNRPQTSGSSRKDGKRQLFFSQNLNKATNDNNSLSNNNKDNLSMSCQQLLKQKLYGSKLCGKYKESFKNQNINLNKNSANNIMSKRIDKTQNKQMVIQQKQIKKMYKKLINEKYNQFNKSKFKLNGFKTDKFI